MLHFITLNMFADLKVTRKPVLPLFKGKKINI